MTSKAQKSYWPISVRWVILICVGLVAISIFQDYYYSVRNHSSFYFSESILFNSFWLFFIPGLHVFFVMMNFCSRKKWYQYLLAIVATIFIHWCLFAVMIYGTSALFYEHPYSVKHTMKYSISTLSLSSLLIYGISMTIYLRRPISKATFLTRIQIRKGNQIKSIDVDDIVCIQSESPYVSIHTSESDFLYSGTLKSLENQLDPTLFVRIHKSCIVNLAHVKSYRSRQNGDYDVHLKNEKTVRLSRNYLAAFKSRL